VQGEYNIKKDVWTGGRVRTDQELRELYKDLDIVADIKKQRLPCIAHVVRIDQGMTVNKILEIEPEGSRRKGRTGVVSRPWL
jgi:hypothetical protein